MIPHAPLPGLERLIAVCQRHSLPLELSPALPLTPEPGKPVLGKPLDPQLASVYRRLCATTLGPITLYSPGQDEEGLNARNEWAKGYDNICFDASLLFGQELGFAEYFATVPKLANLYGLQPVIYITAHGAAVYAVPIASSVDRFFHLYSLYLERMVVDFEYVHTGVPDLVFPWGVPELVAADAPLISQVRAGHFDFLTNGEEGAHKWLRELSSPPSSPL